MKNNKNLYFYSELEDQVIVNSTINDFKERQAKRKPYELNWELNLNYYLGNQNTYIASNDSVCEFEKFHYWESKNVYNHIAPIIESRLAKLTKVKPHINVRPSSQTDPDVFSAKLGKSILNNNFETNDLYSLVSTATHWSEITGTCFYKITWENDLGNIISINDSKSIKNGDVKISLCSPFEIFPDNNSTQDIESCHSIIHARPVDLGYIKSIWNVDVSEDAIDLYELNNISVNSDYFGKNNSRKVTHKKSNNSVLLIERYEKPNTNNPNGKFTAICGEKLLYDGDLPYNIGKNGEKSYPFVKQVSIKQIASFWGSSVIERCIPIQQAYNSIKNKKHEYITRLASGVLTVEDGSVDIDNLENEGLAPGKILVYRSGSTPPEFLSPGTIPDDFEKEEEKLLAELGKMGCISDLSTSSSVPKNINSGSALNLLIEQDESRLALVAEHIRTAIKNIATITIRLYKQYASVARLTKSNNDGLLEIYYWTNNDLTSDDIYLETENELQDSLISQKETLLSIYEKGLLNGDDGVISSANKIKLLEILGFPNWEIPKDLSEMHKEKAHNENIQTISLENPLDIDDHNIHINEHIKYIISDFTQKINNDFKIQLLNHIKQHKKLIGE